MSTTNGTTKFACTKCGKKKPQTTDFFHRDKTGPNGFRTRCKDCSNKREDSYKHRRRELRDVRQQDPGYQERRREHRRELEAKRRKDPSYVEHQRERRRELEAKRREERALEKQRQQLAKQEAGLRSEANRNAMLRLVKAHRAEFDTYVAGEITHLRAARDGQTVGQSWLTLAN